MRDKFQKELFQPPLSRPSVPSCNPLYSLDAKDHACTFNLTQTETNPNHLSGTIALKDGALVVDGERLSASHAVRED
jgi:hypothetical protein